jgi:hypothetical protein
MAAMRETAAARESGVNDRKGSFAVGQFQLKPNQRAVIFDTRFFLVPYQKSSKI